MKTVSIDFTPTEREAVLHRLTAFELFGEVFADTDGMEHLADAAEARARELADALEDSGVTLTATDSELDREILREAIEGSTWNGVHSDAGEVSQQKSVAAARALEKAARKIEIAFGLPDGDIAVPWG